MKGNLPFRYTLSIYQINYILSLKVDVKKAPAFEEFAAERGCAP